MTSEADIEAGQEPAPLGLELRKLRKGRGLSQSRMAELLGLASRGAIADYESGRRLPPNDVLTAYERVFVLPQAHLRELRISQLSERAESEFQEAISKESVSAVCSAPTRGPIGLEPPVGRRFGRRLMAIGLFAAAAVTAVTVGSAHAHSVRSLGPTWTERNQHVSDHAERAAVLDDMDGDDPRARDCLVDATVAQAIPFAMPDGSPGTLRLRHSAYCGASWASAYYANLRLFTVRLAAHRPADGAEVHSEWSNNTPPGSYGDLLSTSIGCVWVEVSVVGPAGPTAAVRTHCLK